MTDEFSQFRNHDINSLLGSAAQIAASMSLANVTNSLLFIAITQEHSDEVQNFLTQCGADPSEFFNDVASTFNSITRSANGQVTMAAEVVATLNLTLQIEHQIPPCQYEHGSLIAALLISASPMRQIAQRHGLTAEVVKQAIIPQEQQIVQQNSHASTVASEPAHSTEITAGNDERARDAVNENQGTPLSEEQTNVNNCPVLKQFGVNMLAKAIRGELERVIGRDEEILRLLQILARKTKSNPVLVGDPGTGKTAIIEGLACRIAMGQVPQELSTLKLYQLNLNSIMAVNNATEIIEKLLEELRREPQVVVFIDEIHTVISSNAGADNPVANILKPAMARGEIKLIGATTNDEYTKHIEKDKAFERRFQKIIVNEPDEESAKIILRGIASRLEKHHGIEITQQVSDLAVQLSLRYIPDRRLPDKAIDIIDEAAACARLARKATTLTEDDIRDVVTKWTGIPVPTTDTDDHERLKNIEHELHESVIGQEHAVNVVANAIRRNRMGLSDDHKPIGSFLFLGTTGVGKTELSKALAQFMFHSRDMMVRIDMSEYQQEHSSARLFGAPPGYVGYEQGGQLTEAVRRKPYSIVLFDEIEKAHPKIYETLLQVLDDGRMTDGQGRVVDFRNTIVIMTSNIGQAHIMHCLSGHEPTEERIEQATTLAVSELKTRVAPEFINRIDNIVMFLPLTLDDVRNIARLQVNKLTKQLAEQNISLTTDDTVVEFIATQGFDPQYGARPVKRAINTLLKDKLIDNMVNGIVTKTLPISATVNNDTIVFTNIPTAE